MKFRKHPLLSGLALLVALALALAAALLFFERTIRIDGLRGRVEAALGGALGAEAHIDGPLRLITGWRPGIEVEGLRLAGAAGDAKWTAETREARLRLDFPALLRREIDVAAADLRDARLCATTDSQARKPRAPRGESGWRVGGIERLRIERVDFFAGPSCAGEPWARIASLEASLPAQIPLRLEAAGALKGASWRAELRGPPFATLAASSAASRFALSADVAGTRLRAQIEATPSPFAASAQLEVDADELLPLTQLVDAPLKGFGPLHARANLEVNAARFEVRVDEARIAPGAVAGGFSLDWSTARPRASLELRGDALDADELRKWLTASLDRPRLKPGRLARRVASAVRASDGNLSLQFARVGVGPVVLESVGADGGWTAGVLRAQLAASYGKSPLAGSLEADMRGEELALALEGRAKGLVLPGDAGISGSIGSASAKFSARAAPGALRQAARGSLELRDARLRLPFLGGRLPPLAVATAHAEWPGGGTLRVGGAGSMGELRAQARGELGLEESGWRGDLDFTASSDALAGLPLEARGRARLGEADWRLELASMRLGQTRGRATVAGARPPAKRPIAASAEFELLDIAELTQGKPKGASALWERELLPRGVRLPDASLEIDAARVVLPQNASLRLRGTASVRGGRIAGVFEARDLSLPQFGATVGRVTLEASTSGTTLAALAGDATLKLEARDGRLTTRLEGAELDASFAEASLSAAPGARTLARAAGSVFGLPLALQATGAPLAQLLPAGGGEFDLSGRIGEAGVSAVWSRGSAAKVGLRSPRLDTLDELLGVRLPATGPVTLEASLNGLGTPRLSADATLQIAETRVSGRFAGQRGADGRPRFEVALNSSLVRLEDLGVAQWAGQAASAKGGTDEGAAQRLQTRLARAEAQAAALRRTLRKFDAQLSMSVARITSGAAQLGHAQLAAMLERGRLNVAPLSVEAPRGRLSLSLDADLSSDEPSYRLESELDQFRYGALVRGVDSAGKGEGTLSLKLELSARGRLGALAPSIDGTADFLIFPAAISSRALELWGGGLLRLIAAVLDKEKGARVNCGVAAFNISRGIAKSEALMVDSTGMRAAGELEVNLADQRLKGFMAPKTKTARLLSPEVPVGIGGTIDNPKVGVEVAGIPRSAVRTFYFVPTYLYDAFLSGSMPADGSEDCIKAYRRISTK